MINVSTPFAQFLKPYILPESHTVKVLVFISFTTMQCILEGLNPSVSISRTTFMNLQITPVVFP